MVVFAHALHHYFSNKYKTSKTVVQHSSVDTTYLSSKIQRTGCGNVYFAAYRYRIRSTGRHLLVNDCFIELQASVIQLKELLCGSLVLF